MFLCNFVRLSLHICRFNCMCVCAYVCISAIVCLYVNVCMCSCPYLFVWMYLCAAFVAQWFVLSLFERKVVGSNPPTVVRTPCRSPRLAPGYMANAR